MRQPNQLGALLPFDSGENAINPNAGILKISKQISDSYPFTINADQTEIHFTLKQNNHLLQLFLYRASRLFARSLLQPAESSSLTLSSL